MILHMTPSIQVKPLSQNKRRVVFGLSLLLFACAVPVFVLYAIGYRFDFNDTLTTIKSVGGMYIRSDVANTEMFINDEPVTDMRVFQKAAYIQNLDAGMHRIHTQGASVQTWVKELPVYPHFVTEAASFNLPKNPQIRIITPWRNTITGAEIILEQATSTKFHFASTTNALEFSTTTATSLLEVNTEYVFIESLFASSTELKKVLAQQQEDATKRPFTFNISTSSQQIAIATTTKKWRDFTLYKNEEDVFVSYTGDMNKIPYYYCVTYSGEKQTAFEYGLHVYSSLKEQLASTTDLSHSIGDRLCRNTIRIDRLNQEVQWFDFFANNTDIVLIQLEEGLYAVEVDDRAWQNTQLLYPGTNLEVLQDGGRIYVHDGKYFVEVFTEIASQ